MGDKRDRRQERKETKKTGDGRRETGERRRKKIDRGDMRWERFL